MSGQAREVELRRGREGARWINERPSPEDFAKWAAENIKIDDDLSIEDYIGGIVLIPAVDKKSKYVSGFNAEGMPLIGERPEMVYVPYPKVETRLQYFWDLLGAHDDWIGVVEPVKTARPELETLRERTFVFREEGEDVRVTEEPTVEAKQLARSMTETFTPATVSAIVHQLPDGFFVLPVPSGGGYTYFLCCSYRVAIYEKAKQDGRPIREGRGTKQVALLTKGYNDSIRVDDNAIMKAETGAIGRALGAAGIFNIPGSGVATAEDMLEQAAAGTPTASTEPDGAGPAAPAQAVTPDEKVRETCKTLLKELREDFPATYEEFGEWCSRRRPQITGLGEIEGAVLRGVCTKLEKMLVEAKAARAARGEEPEEGGAADEPVAEELPDGGQPAL